MNTIIYRCALVYWFLFRPKTSGVKCLITNRDSILLIRNAYGKPWWNLPGGGVEHGETPEIAVLREVKEETGITLLEVSEIGIFFTTQHYKRDTVYCFYAEVYDRTVIIDSKEIIEARWFPVTELPVDISRVVKKVLDMRITSK